jgi:archaellum component FlaD/FlaE
MSKLEELLNELEGQEKTAEEVFASKISEESSKEESAEKTAADKASEEVSKEEAEAKSESEEKTASAKEETPKSAEALAEKVASKNDEELVKIAKDMGQIAAHTFYAELVAMGIMPPTNKDIPVPPISSVSMPQQSPVVIKADAEAQMQAGHDGYDLQHNHAPTDTGKAQQGLNEGMMKKKASLVTTEFLTNFYNKLNSEEN